MELFNLLSTVKAAAAQIYVTLNISSTLADKFHTSKSFFDLDEFEIFSLR